MWVFWFQPIWKICSSKHRPNYPIFAGCGFATIFWRGAVFVSLFFSPKKTWMLWMRTSIFTYIDPRKINWMYVDSISVICESFPLRHQHRPTNTENVMRKAARPQWVTQSFIVDVLKLSKLHRVFPKKKGHHFLWTYSSSHFFFLRNLSFNYDIFGRADVFFSATALCPAHEKRGFLACFWVTLPLSSSLRTFGHSLGHRWTNAHDFPWKNNSSSWWLLMT